MPKDKRDYYSPWCEISHYGTAGVEGICDSVALLPFHNISKVKSGELAFITGLSSFPAPASSMPVTRSVML